MTLAQPIAAQGSRNGDTPTISAVIITCNEVEVIEACLQSVADWVDDVVVVDMHSSDGTRETALKYGVRLIDHERLPLAEPARNFAFAQARGEWIIMLDPDERVPTPLARELRDIALANNMDAVRIRRQESFFGRPVTSRDFIGVTTRFFRKGSLVWPAYTHGQPDLTGLRYTTLSIERADLALQHDTWRTVSSVLDRIRRYAPDDVKELRSQGKRFSLRSLIDQTRFQFVGRMVDGRAYEDGMPGLLTTLYFAIYFLTVQAEMWEAEGRSTEYDQQILRWGRRLTRLYRIGRGTKRVASRATHLLQGPN